MIYDLLISPFSEFQFMQRALAGSGIEAEVDGRQILICAAGNDAAAELGDH